jgi:hypothetical protein
MARKEKEKTKRRFSVHPLIFQRDLKGAFVTLYTDVREDETKFFLTISGLVLKLSTNYLGKWNVIFILQGTTPCPLVQWRGFV